MTIGTSFGGYIRLKVILGQLAKLLGIFRASDKKVIKIRIGILYKLNNLEISIFNLTTYLDV